MKEKALAYLNEDRPRYAGALFALSQPDTEVLYAESDGVFIRTECIEYAAAKTDAAARNVLRFTAGDTLVCYDRRLDTGLETLGYVNDMTCRSALYEGTEPIKLTLPDGAELRRLTHAWDDYVYSHYSHAEGRPDYVSERIEAGMLGVFENGVPAGFVGTHDTGEMGLLEVLPAYRRKGYARLLEAALINERLRDGLLPYGDIEITNEASLALQRSLGMTVSDHIHCWFLR